MECGSPCLQAAVGVSLRLLLFFPFFPMQRLNENLGKLTAKFEKATSDKLKCQQEAEATACTITLANWLVSGSRWELAAASMGDVRCC